MASLQLIDTYARGQPVLQQRFLAARLQCAWDILKETPVVAANQAWARKIFGGYGVDMDKEYNWLLSHQNIQTAGDQITDANLIAAVKSFVPTWAAEDAAAAAPAHAPTP